MTDVIRKSELVDRFVQECPGVCAECKHNRVAKYKPIHACGLIIDARCLAVMPLIEGTWERLDCVGDKCRAFRCPVCGHIVEPGYYVRLIDDEFCSQCGAKLYDRPAVDSPAGEGGGDE